MTSPVGSVTRQLLEQLQRHYLKPGEALPGGVFVPECGWNGSSSANSHARSRVDALYVGFTASSGRMLIGHELKVSRADWRHELDKPGKADAWHDECHAWYIVTPSRAIVPIEELPDGWGLMVPNSRSRTRMDTVVKARTYPDRVPSWEATRSILARVDTLRAQTLEADREAARQKAAEEQRQAWEKNRDRLPADVQMRLDDLERIEAILGTKVTGFGDGVRPEVAARAVQLALQLATAEQEIADVGRRQEYALRGAEAAASKLLDSISSYRAAADRIIDGERAITGESA